MTKREIAQTVVDICKNDASFCKDINGGDPERFLSEIFEGMDEKAFLFSVDKYLASFGIRGHLYFYKKGSDRYIGFRVRRYKDRLFVTNSEEELPLSIGDEILAIDGLSIPQVAEKFKVFFEEATDRQSDQWEKIISYSDKLAVKRAEKTFDYFVRADIKRTEKQAYGYRKINGECFYIKLDNFFDETVGQFLDCCMEEIESTRYLIIDVRQNSGGSDTVFLPLLKYCLQEDDLMCGKPIFTSQDEVLYTERNVENRIKLYNSYIQNSSSEEVRRYFKQQILEQMNNKGKGFVSAKEDGFLFANRGTRLPEKIAVLSDYDYGSSGESFVETVSKLDKVTVIGRSTMGICDYSNLAYFDFGEYVLHYPTSRSKAIDQGKGTRGRGLQPDIYIPWTPKHLREDVDIMTAIRYLT